MWSDDVSTAVVAAYGPEREAMDGDEMVRVVDVVAVAVVVVAVVMILVDVE